MRSEEECSSCGGSGTVQCSTCGGVGGDMTEVYEDGEEVGEAFVPCSDCNGSGRETCAACC